ncbi:hypothetical protein KEU06_09560 [Pseudaminobacter sp. 19-2017]|uniref:Uncharacterized protein n=1 Tax=Pseudaminobacter soli (ex Zhang et al. 2022) TaxID=2831468 RepID=A0A942E5I9_9HYPH|nr:hypothetical protein [Pseudaminobacter soli]MBS3648852.1 hypothetical protein [Pseudaminobacter soli]
MQVQVVRKPNRLSGRKLETEVFEREDPPSRDAGVKARFLIDRHGTPEAALGFIQERLLFHVEGTETYVYWKAVAAVVKRIKTGKKDGDHRRGRGELKVDPKSTYFRIPKFVKEGLGPIIPEPVERPKITLKTRSQSTVLRPYS